jgi:hypothetical protein
MENRPSEKSAQSGAAFVSARRSQEDSYKERRRNEALEHQTCDCKTDDRKACD